MKFGVVVIAIVAAFVLSATGSASLPTGVSTQSYFSTDSAGNPCASSFNVNQRHYCIELTTYNGLARSGGVEVDVTIQNYDQSSLTNPASDVTWAPVSANLSFVQSDPAGCTYPSPSGGVACRFPNIPGVGSGSGGNPPPHNDVTVKLFFSVDAPANLGAITFAGVATAKESGNDNGGAANAEQQFVPNPLTLTPTPTLSFGADQDLAATVALPGKKPVLSANLGSSSVTFKVPPGSNPFFAGFEADSLVTPCFGGITCHGLQLSTNLGGTTYPVAPYILWQAVINSTNTNVVAIHYYDPVSVTASAPKTFGTATSFAACDGVNFGTTPPGGLSANTDYFVINASSGTTFQVATSANGKALPYTGSGPFDAKCIRVIGDQKVEKATSCTTPPSVTPAFYAEKLTNSTVRVCLWDTANGNINV